MEGYRKTFSEFNELAKKELQIEKDPEALSQAEREVLDAERDATLADAETRHRSRTSDTQRAVFELQKQKQERMTRLRDELHSLDAGEQIEWPKDAKQVFWDAETRAPYLLGRGGIEKIPLTRGGMMVAPMWGVSYKLPDTMPRELKRRYLLEAAKYDIGEMRDRQIAMSEADASYHQGSGYDEAYRATLEDRQEPEGILAERMVKSFLTSLCYDHDVPFEVKDVDVRQDVEGKIDFIIHIERDELQHERGVAVEDADMHDEIGVQFTIAQSEKTIEKKERQLRRARWELSHGERSVDDIVLVQLSPEKITDSVEAWKKLKGRVNGGPESLWSETLRERVFKGVLKELPVPIDANALWEKVRKQEG
jgi:hypothetical protein